MQLFYTPDLNGDLYYLNETESKHCIRVLRLNINDHIQLIDGIGGFYTAKIIDPNPKNCMVEIVESKKEFGKRNHHIHIAIAPTKNIDRFEWFLEKVTEIGIDEITPLLCEHSERKVLKSDRLEKVIISAVKQSIKAYKPKLNEIIPIKDFLSQKFDTEKYIAHCKENEKVQLKNVYKKGQNTLILIGPEGDFSTLEIELAKKIGFQEISLGKSRLRTETAGVVACHIISLLNE